MSSWPHYQGGGGDKVLGIETLLKTPHADPRSESLGAQLSRNTCQSLKLQQKTGLQLWPRVKKQMYKVVLSRLESLNSIECHFYRLFVWSKILLFCLSWPQTFATPASVTLVLGLQTCATKPACHLHLDNSLPPPPPQTKSLTELHPSGWVAEEFTGGPGVSCVPV